jgi:hypothetical protein
VTTEEWRIENSTSSFFDYARDKEVWFSGGRGRSTFYGFGPAKRKGKTKSCSKNNEVSFHLSGKLSVGVGTPRPSSGFFQVVVVFFPLRGGVCVRERVREVR